MTNNIGSNNFAHSARSYLLVGACAIVGVELTKKIVSLIRNRSVLLTAPANLNQHLIISDWEGPLPHAVGREKQLNQIMTILRTEQPHVLLKGPKGAGQTALLKLLAHHLSV